MATIDFITSNPATEAFQRAERARQEADASDLRLETGWNELDEKRTTLPTRLRQLEANTSTAETGAKVAKDVAPYAAPKAYADLRRDRANATSSEAEAAVAAPKAQAGLRSVKSAALNSEMTPFYKSIERIDAGDVEGAKSIAGQAGLTIPDAVFEDADKRRAVIATAKRAQEAYPDMPKKQQAYISGKFDEIQSRIAKGEDPKKVWREAGTEGVYTSPASAPDLPDTTNFKSRWDMLPASRTNPDTGQPEQGYIHHDKTSGDSNFVSGTTLSGKNGAGAGGGSSMTERLAKTLQQEATARGETLSTADAIALTKKAPNGDMVQLRKESLALSAAKADTGYLTNPAQTIEKYRKMYGLGAVPAPAPAPAPSSSRVVQPSETITGITSTPPPVQPSPQRPMQMSPGDGRKPYAVEAPPLPPSMPQGVQYQWSPTRRQYKDELGRVYDERGNPVT